MRMNISKAFAPKIEATIARPMGQNEFARFRFHEIIDGLVFGAEEGIITHDEASAKMKEILDDLLNELLV